MTTSERGEGAAPCDAPTNRLTHVSLTSRHPELDVSRILEDFVPPPHFGGVSFDTYLPDPAQPTQAAALAALRAFAGRIAQPEAPKPPSGG